MAIPTLKAIGFCAHYSQQGDWAFDFALKLAQDHSVTLDVFHFLADPYDPTCKSNVALSKEEREKLIIQQERELRMYYDERAGDYMEVGFRLCEDSEWIELHRCLAKREFQVLVIGYPNLSATFGGKPIVEFATAFISPCILVGPDSPQEYQLNKPAAMLAEKLGFESGTWKDI